MRIQLGQIREEPYRWSEVRNIPVERLDNSEILELGEVVWQGDIRYAAPGFHLTGSVEYEHTVRCTRCLEAVVVPVQSNIDLTIFVEAADVGAGEHELGASDFGVVFTESDEIDDEPILLEQLQLNVPMRPLCRDDCQGLCPTCGTNRNLTECDCESQATDPRWEALRKLKRKMD